MMTVKLHTNGLIEQHEIDEKAYEYKFEAFAAAIGCEWIDIVHAANLPEGYCLVVDDEGLLKGQPVVNLIASYLYGTQEHGQPLCGDVLIAKDEYTPDGLETVGLEEADFYKVMDVLTNGNAQYGVRNVYNKLKEIRGEHE